MGSAAVEVCEELVFHGIEYILSVSVSEGTVLQVDVEKVPMCRRACIHPPTRACIPPCWHSRCESPMLLHVLYSQRGQ
jgi:hypothetical protein